MIGKGYKCGMGALNDAQPNHTPSIVKQIVKPPITWLSINTSLEAKYRSNIPQNVLTFHLGMSHIVFSQF
jgi:hypothetical protein